MAFGLSYEAARYALPFALSQKRFHDYNRQLRDLCRAAGKLLILFVDFL